MSKPEEPTPPFLAQVLVYFGLARRVDEPALDPSTALKRRIVVTSALIALLGLLAAVLHALVALGHQNDERRAARPGGKAARRSAAPGNRCREGARRRRAIGAGGARSALRGGYAVTL